MVYRIPPHRHSQGRVFWRTFAYYAIIYTLLLFAVSYMMPYLAGEGRAEIGWLHGLWLVGVALVFAAFNAWRVLRGLKRQEWFEPREIFLTMVDEGLIIESPARGITSYHPWRYVQVAHGGGMLQISDAGVPLGAIGTDGLSKEQQAELDAASPRSCPKREAGRLGAFAPENAAAPFAPQPPSPQPKRHADEPPPLPHEFVSPIAPPALEGVRVSLRSSHTPQQVREMSRLHFRPSWGAAAFVIALIAFCGFTISSYWFEGLYLGMLLFAVLAFYFFKRLIFPARRLPFSKAGSLVSFSDTRLLNVSDDGSWVRCPLPPLADTRLVRLESGWSLLRWGKAPCLAVDLLGNATPPVLDRYPRVECPRNTLRGALAVILFCAGLVGGIWLGTLPDEAQKAFAPVAALHEAHAAAGDDEAAAAALQDALDRFVAEHYVVGTLFGKAEIMHVWNEDDEPDGYILCFAESAPCELDDDGGFHLAWDHHVRLSESGYCIAHDSAPVYWCPCDDWLAGPPEWLEYVKLEDEIEFD